MAKRNSPGNKPKPANFSAGGGGGEFSFVQNKIRELREAERYKDAVTLVMANGSGPMAQGTADQKEAVRLMIATWEAIAIMVSTLEPTDRETIFGGTPVGYIYDALEAGILIFRQTVPAYAKKFELLDTAYGRWIGTKSSSYQSRAQQGMNTNFG